MKFVSALLLLAAVLPLCGEIKTLPLRSATPEDYRTTAFVLDGQPMTLSDWRVKAGDKPAYAAPDLDVSDWKTVEVGKSLRDQKVLAANGWCWYRTEFTLPEAWQGRVLQLELGKISAYDEIFLNGVKRGKYGNPPPNFAPGCSYVVRRYLLRPETLKPGRNVLAVRVFAGTLGGLYNGSYTLQPLAAETVHLKLPLKTGGADSLKLLLTEAEHLNRVTLGGELLATPELLNPGIEKISGVLKLTIADRNGKKILDESTPLTLVPKKWQPLRIEAVAPNVAGKLDMTLSFSGNGRVLAEKQFAVEVAPENRQIFQPMVWPELAEPLASPVEISSMAVGRFGPREGKPDGTLSDNLNEVDSRSGMAYSIRTSPDAAGPMLFLGNVRPVPENAGKVGRFHRVAGHQYDGVRDAWIYGLVCPDSAGQVEKRSIKDQSWSGRTYRYDYSGNNYLEFTVRAVSPAWLAETASSKLRVFDGIRQHGIALPRYLAYDDGKSIRVVDADTGIDGRKMAANWVLAWFNGGQGWEEFDTPYLFVLQNRPQQIRNDSGTALSFEFSQSAGQIQGMPLHGVTLLAPEKTAAWSKALPKETVERCRYWSQVLAAPPATVRRTAAVDYERDRLTVRDEVTYASWSDAWKTVGRKITPVSTLLPLSVGSGNFKVGFDRPLRDLQMATLQGPLFAAEDAASLTFGVDNLLHYIREVREVVPGDSPEIAPLKAEFNRLLEQGYAANLGKQPWPRMFRHGVFNPGSMTSGGMTGLWTGYTNLLLARVWMNPEIREKLDRDYRTVSEKYLLYTGMPDAAMRAQLDPKFRELPVVTFLTNPVTGLKLAVGAIPKNSFGIDWVYFYNLNVYMAWRYADTYDRYDWLKEHYPLLQQYFNTARNSHDWATLVSWDTFSGVRVGNGLQESGGIHAGATAMARIAHKFGDRPLSDVAAYHAVMQLVSMQGVLAATEYLRQYRPWSANHTHQQGIEFFQKTHPAYFAELNELAGMSQSIIQLVPGYDSPGSPSGYIESPLPEVMRPYQEVWGAFTDDLYDARYDILLGVDRRTDPRVTVDTYLYQTRRTPEQLREIFTLRQQTNSSWWMKLADYRGYLDSLSTIKYRILW